MDRISKFTVDSRLCGKIASHTAHNIAVISQ